MMKTLERYAPPAFLSLVFLLTYLCLYFGAMPLFGDPDVPWHLATGDLILQQGGMPATDPWSFASNGQPWYIISWLWDVLIALVQRGFGLSGVWLFTLLAMSGLAVLLAHSLSKREHVGSDALILTLLILVLSFMDYTQARPQIAGYFFIVLTQMILHHSRKNEQSRALYLLPLFMVLWVNTHGSFLAGITILGAYGLEALWMRRWAWFKRLFLIGVVCTLALLVNPYGFHMYTAVMRSLNSIVTQYIIEWMPFVFSRNLGISLMFLLFVCVGPLREPRVPLADKIIALLWFVAMLFSMRNAIIFLLVSVPALAIALQSFTEQLASIRTVRPDVLLHLKKPGMRGRMALATLAVLAVTTVGLPVLKGPRASIPQSDPSPAIAWVKEHAIGKRMLSDYNYGGWLIYETRGAVSLFVDGRAGTAYPEAVLTEYIAFSKLQPEWESIVQKYRIDGILVRNQSLFATAYAAGQYRAQWKEVFRDDVASVYMRKK